MYDEMKQKFNKLLRREKQDLYKEYKTKEKLLESKVQKLELENRKFLSQKTSTRKPIKSKKSATYRRNESEPEEQRASLDPSMKQKLQKVDFKTRFN